MITNHADYHVAIAELRASTLFLNWRLGVIQQDNLVTGGAPSKAATEKHYTPDGLAALWRVSAETIRLLFRNEPGVLRYSTRSEEKSTYIMLHIPESVAARVHKRLSAAK